MKFLHLAKAMFLLYLNSKEKIVLDANRQTMKHKSKRQFNQKIDAIVQRIVERFSPQKIILFGSYALTCLS